MSTSIFSGKTAECFQDFLEHHPWDDVRTFLAGFCRVHEATVRRWKNGGLPLGEELLRLRALLDLAGYHVAEYSNQPGIIRQFGQSIALGLIDPGEAQEMLGYKNVDGIYTVLLRGGSVMPDKGYRLERWVENSKKELGEASAKLRADLVRLPKTGDGAGARRTHPPTSTPSLEAALTSIGGEPWDDVAEASIDELGVRQANDLLEHLRSTANILARALDENGIEAKAIRRELRLAIGQGELVKIAQDFERVLFGVVRPTD